MYNSFPNQVSSAAKWIVIAFFVVILMAILLGANIKDATWFNPNIADSEAYLNRIEADHQRAMNELDEQLKAAQTQAAVKEIQRQQALLDAQYQHDVQALEQDIAHRDIAFRTWMTAFTILVSAFALALFVIAVVWIVSRAWVYIQANSRKEQTMAKPTPPVTKWIPNLPERKPYDPWMDPEYRRQQINAARNQEQKEREEMLTLTARMKGISNAQKISKSEYDNLPLAGD